MIDEICSQNFVDHDPLPGTSPDFAGLKDFVTQVRSAFPDIETTAEDILVEVIGWPSDRRSAGPTRAISWGSRRVGRRSRSRSTTSSVRERSGRGTLGHDRFGCPDGADRRHPGCGVGSKGPPPRRPFLHLPGALGKGRRRRPGPRLRRSSTSRRGRLPHRRRRCAEPPDATRAGDHRPRRDRAPARDALSAHSATRMWGRCSRSTAAVERSTRPSASTK